MERLTHYETPEKHAYVDRGLVSLGWYSMTDEGFRGPAIDRLAAYEDTGLEPDVLKEFAPFFDEMRKSLGSMRRLKELTEAEAAVEKMKGDQGNELE